MSADQAQQKTFWEWSLEIYDQPGVAPALLHFQDAHGFHVTQLLACLWMGAMGKSSDSEFWTALRPAFDAWATPVITPLRQLRRHLKQDLAQIKPADRLALREEMRALELRAEQLFMEAIERHALAQSSAAAFSEPSRHLAARNLDSLRLVMAPDFALDISEQTEDLLDLIFGSEEG